MPNRYFSLLFLLLLSGFAVAQNGSIAGQVLDYKTKEAIIGASVVIQGTTVGSATDIEGNFLIANVKPGTYTIVVSYIAYKTQTIPDVVVESGNKTTLSVDLPEDVAELQEIVITAKKEIASDVNLMKSIKDMKLVVSGISSEQIVKLPDRDAAQIAQRVPGITIVDNRFVLIRGVPERYNQVLINGAIGPSTEIDKRSFSFDLIPAGTIDQMLIYKSASAELPGDFAGGVIQLVTKQPSYDDYTSVGLNFGYRINTTFQDYFESEGSSTDWLGFDNGFRALPSNFPSTTALKNSGRADILRQNAGRSLTNNFANTRRSAPLDFGFNFSTSQSFDIGKVRASNLTSLAYSNSYLHYDADFLRYNSFTATSAEKRFEYKDSFYGNDTRVNIMHNWLFQLNGRNKIEFKNLFVQLGEHETTIRRGVDFIQRPSDQFQNYAYHYLSRAIYSGQLDGSHTLGDGSSKLGWVVGVNYIDRNEPDYRRFRTTRTIGSPESDPFIMLLPPSGNLFETGRFWSTLVDKGISHGLNFEKKIGDLDEKRVLTFKAGYYGEFRNRSFDARYMNYLYPSFFDPQEGERLIRLPLSTIFSPDNIRNRDGFVLEEGTVSQDSYTGENILGAGYASALIPVGKFDISAGFRGEYNIQRIESQSNTGPLKVDNPVFAALPLANVAFNISDRSLARVAYGRTINRPEFRELAPFLYYQFEFESGLFGNPNLKTAFIDNIDFRYELYPNPGETFSVGLFYKRFRDPIETYLQITTETPQLFFGNAVTAYAQGIELEFKKSLASLGVSRFLRNTTVNVNTAFIQSGVDIGTAATNQLQNRPLQGQSPYIVNIGLYYNDEESGWSFNTGFNVFGPRIFSVGDVIFPSWWELPRQSLDMQLAKNWFDGRFETKLNAQNLLNAAFRIYQDNDNDNKISEDEAVIQRYQVGTQFALSLNWKFQKK